MNFRRPTSFHTAEVLDRHLTAEGRSLNVFVQINTSCDPSKYGMEPEKLDALIRKLRPFENLRVEQVQHAIASGLQFAR
ncbi:alanine racemase [Serratia sp. CY56907]|uniref:alanine racemase n=1 Tax=Serratia TaxID=613 RepID=UPI003D35E86E